MKKIITFLLGIFSIAIPSIAQKTDALWPILGNKPGQNVIFKPQDYIENEKNSERLFIVAAEGTTVLAPVDGTIDYITYHYMNSLDLVSSFQISKDLTTDIVEFDKQQRKNIASSEKNINPQYISLLISISCGNGEKYSIEGIRPTSYFKTGYKIKKGETLGTVGYCYRLITQPCISVSHGLNGKMADPMAPFGLKSTFIAFKSTYDANINIPVFDLKTDFTVFREAFEEGYPGLYDYTTQENLNKTFQQINDKITQSMTSDQFRSLLMPLLDSLKDNHISISSPISQSTKSKIVDLPIHFGVQNDSLIIYQTLPNYRNLLGKSIIEINGEKADSIINKIWVPGKNDGNIKVDRDYYKFCLFFLYYKYQYNLRSGDKINLTLSDGKKLDLMYQSLDNLDGFSPKRPEKINNGENFELKKIDSKIAYILVKTFSLNEIDIQNISNFIKDLANTSINNLIIDIRGNRGGNDSYSELFSFLAEKPFRTETSCMVTKNGSYNFFKYCSNYGSDTIILFSDFKPIENKRGYYLITNKFQNPNDSVHFGGNVYILINERSLSAATLFAGLVHKYKRGIIIGRETGSCYYQMNAVKFATLYLKNTGIEVKIPLIKVIFDDEMDNDIPWGRGVIPDNTIKLSFDEFFSKDDKILDYTLNILRKSYK